MTISFRAAGVLGILLVCMQLSGCARVQPRIAQIAVSDRERAAVAFEQVSIRECPLALDADITVEMQLLGNSEKSGGVLQYEEPSSFRYAVVDPLGRSHFIMATDGFTFTMVYNREAKAVTGSTASLFWQEYVPQGVSADMMLYLLAGRIPAQLKLKEIFRDRDSDGLWFFAVGPEGIRHEILLDRTLSRVMRQIIRNGKEEVLFDVIYDRYEEEEDSPCPRPLVLRIEGKTITGALSLTIDRVYPGKAIPPENFRINPPDHFEVQEVE